MSDTPSKRRLRENEVLFRQLNEQAHKGLIHVNELAREANQPEFITSGDTPILFFCECSDLKCTERIRIPMQEYSEIHRDKEQFVVKPRHEIPSIEKVIARRPGYNIVHKF